MTEIKVFQTPCYCGRVDLLDCELVVDTVFGSTHRVEGCFDPSFALESAEQMGYKI